MYEIGRPVPLTIQLTNAAGTVVNAATVALTLIPPPDVNGVPQAPIVLTVTNPPATLGLYTYDYYPMVAGRFTYLWQTTNPTVAWGDSFDVVDSSAARGIVGLTDMRARLKLTSTAQDEDLRALIISMTEVVEDVVGPVLVRNVSELYDLGHVRNRSYSVHAGYWFPFQQNKPEIVLSQRPVLALVSIVGILSRGITYDVSTVDLDKPTGIIRQIDDSGFIGPVRITYTVGRPIIPNNILEGTREIIRHQWESRRGAAQPRPVQGSEDMVATPSGFLIPNRAMEWLNPSRRELVIA